MDQINTVRSFFIYNYGWSPLKAELLTFLTLGDVELPNVTITLTQNGPQFSCSQTYESARLNRPMMRRPPGQRIKIDSPLREKATAVYEKYGPYDLKTLIYLARTKTYYQYRDVVDPLPFTVQLEWFNEMRSIYFAPDAHTLSDTVTDAEYINWEPECMTHAQARARYINCLRHETKIAYQLGQFKSET